MKTTKLNGRDVQIDEIQFGADVCDSFIVSAYYIDDDSELSEDDLERLTNNESDLIYEEFIQHQVERAEYYEGD